MKHHSTALSCHGHHNAHQAIGSAIVQFLRFSRWKVLTRNVGLAQEAFVPSSPWLPVARSIANNRKAFPYFNFSEG
jgi:hypothetical protein